MRYRRVSLIPCLAAGVALAAGAALAASADQARLYNGWCEATRSAAWGRVLSKHVVALSRTTSLHPFALAPDGRSFFTNVRSPQFEGVAEVNGRTSALTKIRPFRDRHNDQALGAFDGRWLVWKEFHGFEGFDDFTVYAWDSHTGHVWRIGAARKAPSGGYWKSPFQGPVVANGRAVWVQGSGTDGLAQIHSYDLRRRRGRVIHTGHAEGPFFLTHGRVAWPESPTPGSLVRMYVASAETGRRVPTPRALAGLRGISGLVTDGRRIAYPSARFTSLWWAASLRRDPTEILSAGRLLYVDNSVQIGGRYIGFGIQPRLFLADTTTRRYVQLENAYGDTELDAKALLVEYGRNTKKALDFRAHIVLVPLRDLPAIPACR